MTKEYSGYKNYETWNVVLWIANDYPVYNIAQGYKRYPQPFLCFRDDLDKSPMLKCRTTGDGVSLWDSKLDIKAIDEAIVGVEAIYNCTSNTCPIHEKGE